MSYIFKKFLIFILLYVIFPLHADIIIVGETQYEIISLLGDGSSGVVFLAKHSDGEFVALKQMHSKQDWEKWDPTNHYDSLFENGVSLCAIQELQLSHVLTHPSIVKIHHIFNAKGNDGAEHTYVIMDYIDGSSLRHTVDNFHTRRQAIQNVIAFLDVIKFALAKGFAYLDLSSSNIMFNKQNELKIIDLSSFEPITETFFSHSDSYFRSIVHYSLEVLRKGRFTEMEMDSFQESFRQKFDINELLESEILEYGDSCPHPITYK